MIQVLQVLPLRRAPLKCGRLMHLTEWFLLLLLLSMIGYAMAIGMWDADHSVSETIYRWCCDYPALAFALGFVCGHWFWPLRK